MKNSFFKRSVSLLLSLIICLSTIVGVALTASAASTTGKAIVIGYPRNGDANYSTVTWGHDELHFMGGWMSQKGRHTTFYTMNSYSSLDNDLYTTQKLKLEFERPITDDWMQKFNRTVREIRLYKNKAIGVVLLNGQLIRKEQKNGTSDCNKSAESSSCN